MDLQKAFDKVLHDKLLHKIKEIGIGVSFPNGVTSEWIPVTSGVPQGSVLGSVLFIIYINDIDLGVNNFISKFADDTKIGNAVLAECDRRSIQEDLRKISDWSVKLEMPFNINKCQTPQVGSRNIKKDYEMCGVKIKSVRSVKDLASQSRLTLSFHSSATSPLKKQTG